MPSEPPPDDHGAPPPAPDLSGTDESPAASRSGPPSSQSPPPSQPPSGAPTPSALPANGPAAATTPLPFDDPEATPHRLPLRSLIGGINPRALFGILPAFLVLRDAAGWAPFAAIAGIAVVVQGIRLLAWSRFRWGFDGQVLRVESGVLWRQLRALDVDRIQQVDIQRPLLHQVMGTASVKVETASEGGESEVALDGLDNDVAIALQAAILTARARRRTGPATPSGATGAGATGPAALAAGPPSPDAQDVPRSPGSPVPPSPPATTDAPHQTAPTTSIVKPGIGDLVRSALTGSSLLVVPVSIIALAEFVFDFAGEDLDDVATEAAQAGARVGVVAIALLVLVVGAVGAVIATLLRDWEVELVRQGDDLRLTRGLLNRQTATIPMHRLQVVEYRQNWLRRTLGGGTLVLRSAGGAGTAQQQQQSQRRDASIPWVAAQDLPDVLAAVLAGTIQSSDDLPSTIERHPPAARRRLVLRWARGLGWLVAIAVAVGVLLDVTTTVPAGVLLDLTTTWGAAMATGLVVVVAGGAWVFGSAQYRRLGHATTSRVVQVTGGILGARSDWMPLGRLQGVEGLATVFQRRLDLASIRLSPAGQGNTPVVISDVATATASRLGTDLTMVAAGRG